MTLEVYNKKFEKIQTAEYEMSTWSWDRINEMAAAGYSFKLDGKWIKIGDNIQPVENCESQPETKRFKDIQSVEELEEICKVAMGKFEEENPELVEKAYTNIAKKFLSSDNLPKSEDKSEDKSEVKDPNLKPMLECIQTGKLYAKQSHAARDLGIDPAYVSDSIKTGKQHKGYSFRKVLKPVQ